MCCLPVGSGRPTPFTARGPGDRRLDPVHRRRRGVRAGRASAGRGLGYEAIGGHERLRFEVADDVKLGG